MGAKARASRAVTRRELLGHAAMSGLGLLATSGTQAGPAQSMIDLAFPGGASQRPLTTAFPQKEQMILQRMRPPVLETPFDVFDQGVFTPNDRFFVRWHWSGIPTSIDVDRFTLTIRGHVDRNLTLSLLDLTDGFERVELAAVNQCAGNSRGFFMPRVAGSEWGNGAMGNALWSGVRLKDVLDRAGVKPGAVQVRFRGLDMPAVADGPQFMKSLDIDRARDGEVMIAYAMNGVPMPLLNGFPLRLVVPGWFATYWVKMLSDIEVLDTVDTNFWMRSAYTIPATPHANVAPGETSVKMVPISAMPPRSFVTNLRSGARLPAGRQNLARGIAFGGDCGAAKVEISTDGGRNWQVAQLDKDEGKYSFRRWQAKFVLPAAGSYRLMSRCTNDKGVAQPDVANWNPSGFMRNVVETLDLVAV